MNDSDYDGVYVCKISPIEKRAFNLTLKMLLKEKEVTKAQIFKIMSGLRENTNGNEKIKLATSKSLLKRLHKLGLITIFRDEIRTGNFLLYSNVLDVLDEDNQNKLTEKLGIGYRQIPDKKA